MFLPMDQKNNKPCGIPKGGLRPIPQGKEPLVFGIDPGYDRLGVAFARRVKGKDVLVYSDCLESKKADLFLNRILFLGKSVSYLIKKWKPDFIAIEKLFFVTNQKTASQVAEVRGMLLYITACHGYQNRVYEYTPLEIKLTVAGFGRAEKRQVALMVNKITGFETKGVRDDEIDAIAVALTCLARDRYLLSTQKKKGY
jgi:crossover junction endodeoxyribonuclease RuvC